MRTINGRRVASVKVFEADGLWRWRIIDALGTEYLDGGNYRSREAADQGLDDAYDPPADPQAGILNQLLREGGYSQRGAAKELEISERMMRYYCAGSKPVPRVVMLAVQHLVNCPASDNQTGVE